MSKLSERLRAQMRMGSESAIEEAETLLEQVEQLENTVAELLLYASKPPSDLKAVESLAPRGYQIELVSRFTKINGMPISDRVQQIATVSDPPTITAADLSRIEEESKRLHAAFTARTKGMETLSADDLKTRVK